MGAFSALGVSLTTSPAATVTNTTRRREGVVEAVGGGFIEAAEQVAVGVRVVLMEA